MSRVNTKLANLHEYVIGGSGSGKSYYVKSRVGKAPRLIIWDPDDEYGEMPDMAAFNKPSELLAYVKGKSRFRVRLVRNGKAFFDWLCGVVLLMGDCVFVAEEIADVTSVSKAGEHWGTLVRRGRKYGVQIMAVSQRPAEADKTIFTQVNTVRSGRLDGEGDKKRVADNMGVPLTLIENLRPLDFIELNRKTGVVRAGHKNRDKVIRNGYGEDLIL